MNWFSIKLNFFLNNNGYSQIIFQCHRITSESLQRHCGITSGSCCNIICVLLSEWLICIFWVLTVVVSTICISRTKSNPSSTTLYKMGWRPHPQGFSSIRRNGKRVLGTMLLLCVCITFASDVLPLVVFPSDTKDEELGCNHMPQDDDCSDKWKGYMGSRICKASFCLPSH